MKKPPAKYPPPEGAKMDTDVSMAKKANKLPKHAMHTRGRNRGMGGY